MTNNKPTIFVDGSFYKQGGIGRVYENIIKVFIKGGIMIYTNINIHLVNDFKSEFADENDENIIVLPYSGKKFSLIGMIELSKIIKNLQNKIDVFIFPHINLPFYIPNKSITFIHDIRYLTEFWDKSLIKKQILTLYLKNAIYKSKYLICVSNYTENTLITKYPEAACKTKVIYPLLPNQLRIKESEFDKENSDINSIGKYILYVGNRKSHKNVGKLIKAYSLIKDKIPHKLVIAGPNDNRNIRITDGVVEIESPSDSLLKKLYTNADLFVFPSMFEGFGLPPFEAISNKCPVILSKIPVFLELFGNSSLYFNPFCEKDMAEKILHILTNETEKRNLLEKQEKVLNCVLNMGLQKGMYNLIQEVMEDEKEKATLSASTNSFSTSRR